MDRYSAISIRTAKPKNNNSENIQALPDSVIPDLGKLKSLAAPALDAARPGFWC
jgi:hypothetical protein